MGFKLPAAAILLALGLAPAAAWGHGEFPQSTGLLWPPGEEEVPWVQTTFGLLVPQPAGGWRWLCEEVLPRGDLTTLAVDVGGRWLVGGIYGLNVSEDGCDWELMGGALAGLYVTQLEADRGDPRRLLAATSTAGERNALWQSVDGGETFTERASFGEGSTVRGFVQGEGGLPLYAVGWREGSAWLWASADGASWSEHPVEGSEGGGVRPLAVDPSDPQIVWLKADVTPSGDLTPTERLIRATAGGAFRSMLDVPDAITAFALSPDGGVIEVGGRSAGMYTSTDGGEGWTGPRASPEAGCLSWAGGRRYQCANNYLDGGSVLVGPAGAGASVQRFADVHGVLSCPAESQVARICGALWPEVKALAGLDSAPADPTPTAAAPTPEGDPPRGCGERGGGGAALILLGLALGRRRRNYPSSL